MSNQKQQASSDISSIFPYIAIPVALVVGVLLYVFVLGNPANFEGGDPIKGHPLNVLGTVHKGGFIVPVLITVNLVVIIFFVERLLSLQKAKGRGSVDRFLRNVRGFLSNGQIDQAINECDKQRGSVAAVIKAGLTKYKAVADEPTLDKEAKVTAIKQELEEATSLELPMLSKNLVILSTCASLGVLVGLLGTVKGMISSFEAMATAGSPDATALSLGISEALVNTFLGILASAIAIILYNFFSTRIDGLTYSMDEAGFSVAQNFASKH
ncbi:MAG: MotA/TolQ/ExbB proton channel family protein [Crocinitomicaceae bacterium]|nr:MotA/TolQ/ExbB proton channel family protein [Crocinitomicaceae bacterium]